MSGDGSNITVRAHDTVVPSSTSDTARLTFSGLRKFNVPIWSSAPHRPQLDSDPDVSFTPGPLDASDYPVGKVLHISPWDPYDPDNHQLMTDIRAWKVANIANDIPDVEVDDPDGADLLVLSWGSTFSAVRAGVGNARNRGVPVAYARIRYLSPFPSNMPTVLSSYKQVMVPELNMGQLSRMIKAEFVTPVISVNKVEGQPFTSEEIAGEIMKVAGR